jgi:hypothetical protein
LEVAERAVSDEPFIPRRVRPEMALFARDSVC